MLVHFRAASGSLIVLRWLDVISPSLFVISGLFLASFPELKDWLCLDYLVVPGHSDNTLLYKRICKIFSNIV